jgi:hypothetical protein
MSGELIRKLAREAGIKLMNDEVLALGYLPAAQKKFADLIIQECVKTLEFHGFDEAVPYVKWMATNKLGVK